MEPINEQTPDDFSNEDSLISDYLNGHLTESEKTAFEKRLLEDSNFAKEVEFQKELALAVRMQERQKLKNSLKEISLKNKAAAYNIPAAASNHRFDLNGRNSQSTTKAANATRYFNIAAVVVIFIVSGVSLIIYLNSNSDLPTTNSTLSKNEEPIFNSKVDPTDRPDQIEQTNTDGKLSANKIEQEQSNESLESKIETKTVKVLPLQVTDEESFGFGSNSSKEITVNIHRIKDSKSNNENQNAYMFLNSDLDIWIDSKEDIQIYNLQEDYVPFDGNLKIKSGFYCRIGYDFYRIYEDDMIKPLIKEDKEVNRKLIYLSSKDK